ncbi:MAG: glycosyltransferase family 2 protein [Candidatus Fimimorpha sp.]
MRFSCIIPVYNTRKKDLDNCIKSVLNQSYTDFELLLIDDGSDKPTASLCDEYALENKKIRVIHQENMGLAGARNSGIDNAQGDFLVHIDSDDSIEIDLLEKLVELIDANGRIDILCWGYRTQYHEYLLRNKTIFQQPYEIIKKDAIEAAMLANKVFDNVAMNTTWGKAYNRIFVIENNLKFDLNLRRSQDVIYNLYAFDSAKNVAYLDYAGSFYRLDNESLSRGYNSKTLERLTKTANACVQFAEEHSEDVSYKYAAYCFCRRCFKMIIAQDFMNRDNKQSRVEKINRFKEALRMEPFFSAYKKNNIEKKPDRDKIETMLIANCHYNTLSFYWEFRKIIRKVLHRG